MITSLWGMITSCKRHFGCWWVGKFLDGAMSGGPAGGWCAWTKVLEFFSARDSPALSRTFPLPREPLKSPAASPLGKNSVCKYLSLKNTFVLHILNFPWYDYSVNSGKSASCSFRTLSLKTVKCMSTTVIQGDSWGNTSTSLLQVCLLVEA